jgi:subtilisin-like proprotein convertase family protein
LRETQCGSAAPAVYGTLRPNNPLSAFDGENLAGTWRLTVVDQATVDDGFLEAWALHFQTYARGA